MRRILGKSLQRLSAILLGLILVLGAMEIVMRWAGEVPRQRNPLRGFHETHSEFGWLGVPNYTARFQQNDFDVLVQHGELGFRAPGHEVREFDDSAVRIAVLGDSFTWGWGVGQGQVYTDHLQRLLGPSAEVRNFGVNAFGTGQELALYRRMVAPWKPNLVVLAVFGNDFHDNVDEKGGRRPFASLDAGKVTTHNVPVRRAIAGRSRGLSRASVAISLLHFHVDRALAHWKAQRKAAKESASQDGGLEAGPATELAEIPAHEKAIFEALLAQFADEVGPKARLWVLYIPERHEVLAGKNDGRGDFVAEVCARRGLSMLDLTPMLHQTLAALPGEHPGAVPLYFPSDMHWSALGHQVAGELLARNLPR